MTQTEDSEALFGWPAGRPLKSDFPAGVAAARKRLQNDRVLRPCSAVLQGGRSRATSGRCSSGLNTACENARSIVREAENLVNELHPYGRSVGLHLPDSPLPLDDQP